MKKELYRLQANYDGLPLEVMTVIPDESPRAVLVIHHGMCEHKERYLWFMQQMAETGYACVIADMRGHGASVYSEDDLGYFNKTDTKGVVLDLHQVVYFAKDMFPGLPLVLMGHSMGSLVVRAYIKAHDFDLAAVILCGAPCKNMASKFGYLMTRIMGLGAGSHRRSRIMYQMAMGGYDKAFKKERKQNAWLSVDKQNCNQFETDPLCGVPFTIDGYRTLTGLLSEVFDKKGWETTDPQLPILLIGGSDDPVMGGVKGFRHTVHFLRGCGYTNVRGKLYAGYRHEILNDTCKEQVIRDLKIWLKHNVSQ